MVDEAARRHWMGVLARAPAAALADVFATTDAEPDFTWLRPPEIGSVMVRGRIGGTGSPFNLGEITVTRCSLRLEGGPDGGGAVGHAYVSGRDREKARIAALCDAMLQGSRADWLREAVIAPMERLMADEARGRAERAAATKVDFFTMVRGEP